MISLRSRGTSSGTVSSTQENGSSRHPKRNPDYGFEETWHELGQPGCFLVGFAPIEDHGFLVTAELQCAGLSVSGLQILRSKNKNYNARKPLLGSESIITKEGADWRAIRRRFNPDFNPSISTRSPVLLSQEQRHLYNVSKRLSKAA